MKKLLIFLFLIFTVVCFSQIQTLENCIKTSDSLEFLEKYDDAIVFLNNNKKLNPNLIGSYVNYLKFRKIGNDFTKKILKKTQKEFLNINNRNILESDFLIKIFISLYKYEFDNNNPESALSIALEGYSLKDFNLSNKKNQIKYFSDLGEIYRATKNPYKAISFFIKSLELNIVLNGENSIEIAKIYDNLGDAYVENYNPSKANESYKKAILILEKIFVNKPEEVDKLLTSYRNLTLNLLNYGEQGEIIKYLKKTNHLFHKNKLLLKKNSREFYFHSRQMQINTNVLFHSSVGEFEIATKYCDSLKAETPLLKNNLNAIEVLAYRYFDVIDYLYEFEDYKKTVQFAHQLAPLVEKFDLIVPKMLVNAKLGTSYEKLKDYDKAIHHIEIASKIVDQQNFNSSKFSIQIIKAIILSGMNKNEEAIDISKYTLEKLVFEKTNLKIAIDKIKFENVSALADSYFINIFEKVADLYLKKFTIDHQKKDLEIAENLYVIAAKLFQEYYLKEEFNNYLDYYHKEITQGLLECLLLKKPNLDKKIEILNFIEQNASQHLIKEFGKKLKRKNSVNSENISQINTLKKELVFYEKQESKSDEIKKDIAEIQSKIKILNEKINQKEKNYTSFNTTDFDLKEIILKLSDEEQILKYYVCNEFIYSILISKNAIEIKNIGEKKELKNSVNKYVQGIKNIENAISKKFSYLSSILLPSGLKKSLIVIPDGFLNYLPFETLILKNTNKFMVENHLISYDYSLPMWLLHQKNNSNNQINLAVFSPKYINASESNLRSDFKDLKYAKIESKKIVNLFKGSLFEEKNATKSNFIKEKENFGIFHLSMHSQLFENDFNQSNLLFSNQEKLYFSELYGMYIPASLVVLSACDTGNGVVKNGEGMMSLSRALTYAGVKSAVVSLWQVPDKETSEIMISFYENLKKGFSKNEALANAKSEFLKNNVMKNHPYYWAGFIVNGDISPLSDTNYWRWSMILISIVLLILIIFFRKKLFQIRK